MRLVTWNILDGGAGRIDRIADVLRALAPDVVALQEANDEDAVRRVAGALGVNAYWGAANSPYAVAWLSRKRAVCQNHRLPVLDKTLLELRIGELRLLTTHLSAGRKLEDEPHRIEEMETVLELARTADVLCGDFNAVHPDDEVGEPPPEEVLEHVSRRPVGLALDAGFVDCYRATNDDRGWTYTTSHPWARLDSVFARRRPSASRVVTEAADASDHFPLLADFD